MGFVSDKNGRALFEQQKRNVLMRSLERAARELVSDAVKTRRFTSFTGNTLSSYSCGVYVGGKLELVVSYGDSYGKPLSKKVGYLRYKYLRNPDEGAPRGVTGTVDTDNLYGQESALDFLQNYSNAPKKGFALVMTTGTEYSEYIEQSRGLTVLTETFRNANNILLNNFKPIP